MFIRVGDFSNVDTLLDLPAHTVPGNFITAGQNFRLRDGKLSAITGSSQLYSTPSIAPYFLLPGAMGQSAYWLYAGAEKVYELASNVHTNITRQTAGVDVDYSLDSTTSWTGGVLNGVGILNNLNDVPQMYTTIGGKLTALSNWPSTLRCHSLRPFQNYLIACNLVDNSVAYPHALAWSHPADPGAVPSSWDHTDPAVDAGRTASPFSETSGELVDSLAAQTVHMVYKTDATYYMQAVGAPFIFNFGRVSMTSGMLTQNCAVNVPGGQVVLTLDDVVFVTPSEVKSLASRRIRRDLFSQINLNSYRSAFLAATPEDNEVWVCIPAGATWANRAYVWNWHENKWSVRELPDLAHAAFGRTALAADPWSASSGTWEDGEDPWGAEDKLTMHFIGASQAGSGALPVFDQGTQNDSSNIAVEVAHSFIDIVHKDLPAEYMKLVRRVRPYFTPESAGAVVYFRIGMTNGISEPVRWTEEQEFTVGTTRDLFVRKQGRYMTWKIRSATDVTWELDGIDVDVAVGGSY